MADRLRVRGRAPQPGAAEEAQRPCGQRDGRRRVHGARWHARAREPLRPTSLPAPAGAGPPGGRIAPMSWRGRRRGVFEGLPRALYRRSGARYLDVYAAGIIGNGIVVAGFGVAVTVLYVDLGL